MNRKSPDRPRACIVCVLGRRGEFFPSSHGSLDFTDEPEDKVVVEDAVMAFLSRPESPDDFSPTSCCSKLGTGDLRLGTLVSNVIAMRVRKYSRI